MSTDKEEVKGQKEAASGEKCADEAKSSCGCGCIMMPHKKK